LEAYEQSPISYVQAHGKLDPRAADQAIVSLGEEDTEGRASITEAESELLREAVTSMLDDTDDAAVAFQTTNGDHRVRDSAISKKKKGPVAAVAAKSSSRVTKPAKAARRAVAKETAEATERSKATVLGELMRLETCTYQQVQMARELLDRFGCAGALTIGELRSRVGLDNGASRALLEMQLSRHGRSKEAIEALVSFLSSIGIVIDMAAAMRESDQRASAFIASRFPTGAEQCQDLLMSLFSFVTCAGGGFVESEEDLAAAHEAGYITLALKEMIFIGSFLQRSTAPESLLAAVLAVIGATDASRPIQDPSEHESPEVIVIED
jgi:DNA-binding transcriptional regulator YbjK